VSAETPEFIYVLSHGEGRYEDYCEHVIAASFREDAFTQKIADHDAAQEGPHWEWDSHMFVTKTQIEQ